MTVLAVLTMRVTVLAVLAGDSATTHSGVQRAHSDTSDVHLTLAVDKKPATEAVRLPLNALLILTSVIGPAFAYITIADDSFASSRR